MAIDAEHPRFVPMTNGRVRWQADRRLAGSFNVALLQRCHIIGFELQPSGTTVIGSFHLPAPQPQRQRRNGRAIACAQNGCISDYSQQIHSPFWKRSAIDSGMANDQTQGGVLMGERFRVGFIALTVV
ncbi:MAG TPA: hypothetical protein VF371_10940, partial [Candidatus Limnocylindrales bacterium]